jgi:hypothetical protein
VDKDVSGLSGLFETRVVRRRDGNDTDMSELAQVSESLVLRSLGYRPSAPAASEWRATSLMHGLDRLFREIGAYLEFVEIARSD